MGVRLYNKVFKKFGFILKRVSQYQKNAKTNNKNKTNNFLKHFGLTLSSFPKKYNTSSQTIKPVTKDLEEVPYKLNFYEHKSFSIDVTVDGDFKVILQESFNPTLYVTIIKNEEYSNPVDFLKKTIKAKWLILDGKGYDELVAFAEEMGDIVELSEKPINEN